MRKPHTRINARRTALLIAIVTVGITILAFLPSRWIELADLVVAAAALLSDNTHHDTPSISRKKRRPGVKG